MFRHKKGSSAHTKRSEPPSLAPSPSTHPSPPPEKMIAIEELELAVAAVRGRNLGTALKLVDDSLSRYPDSAFFTVSEAPFILRPLHKPATTLPPKSSTSRVHSTATAEPSSWPRTPSPSRATRPRHSSSWPRTMLLWNTITTP